MELQLSKKFISFIIAIVMFSFMPPAANAQKKCHHGNCPNGYTCVDGYCLPVGVGCNCLVRPIPPACGQYCGFYADPAQVDELFSNVDLQSLIIRLELPEEQNVSLKLYDLIGRLVLTLPVNGLTQEHQPAGDQTDETGYAISKGVYILELEDAAAYFSIKKLLVLN
jgi:hypothetical protein